MGGGVPVVRERRRGARRGRNTSSKVVLSRQVRWGDTAEAAPVDDGGHGGGREMGGIARWGSSFGAAEMQLSLRGDAS